MECDVISMTHSSVGSINRCVPLSKVTREMSIFLNTYSLAFMIESGIKTTLVLACNYTVDGLELLKNEATLCVIIV